jgi:hypothetical protein
VPASRRVGWFLFPLVGVVCAVLADVLHRATRSRALVDTWYAAEPWLPTLLPAHAGYAVDPWPALIWTSLLLTLGLALAVASTVVLGVVRERPWWWRALLLWAAAVVVAVGTVGLAQAGEWWQTVELFGGRGGSHVRMFTLPALAEAARWGMLWGWVPALVAALARTPRPVVRRRVVVPALLLLVATAVSGAWLATVTHDAAVSTMTEVAQPEPEPTPTGPTDPPPAVAATPEPSTDGRCTADAVQMTAVADAAMGSRALVLAARNVSDAECVLDGYPDVAFADEVGDAVRPDLRPGGEGSLGGLSDVPAEPVLLAPGEAAAAYLTWSGSQAPAGSRTASTVLVAPWAGAPRTAYEQYLDVVDDGAVGLGPWVPAGSETTG